VPSNGNNCNEETDLSATKYVNRKLSSNVEAEHDDDLLADLEGGGEQGRLTSNAASTYIAAPERNTSLDQESPSEAPSATVESVSHNLLAPTNSAAVHPVTMVDLYGRPPALRGSALTQRPVGVSGLKTSRRSSRSRSRSKPRQSK